MRRVVISDLDNTIANGWHRAHHLVAGERRWEDWLAECEKDTPNMCVINLLRAMQAAGNEIWIFTSRGEETREVTERWLEINGVPYEILEMRPIGEREDDLIIKKCWLHKHAPTAEDKKAIQFVLEDRTRVVKMWRELGLRCFQVEENNF